MKYKKDVLKNLRNEGIDIGIELTKSFFIETEKGLTNYEKTGKDSDKELIDNLFLSSNPAVKRIIAGFIIPIEAYMEHLITRKEMFNGIQFVVDIINEFSLKREGIIDGKRTD